MINFMVTTFFGVLFVFSIALLTIGFMFVARVLVILWFDTDFMKKVMDWFHA